MWNKWDFALVDELLAKEILFRGPPAFKVDPTYDDLRSNRRFAQLMRRVGVF